MNKKEFMAISLPYGLYVQTWASFIEKTDGETYDCLLYSAEFEYPKESENNCTPILRPLSDITKPITHNGETFVPIVELAKIAFHSDGDNISESNCIITSEMMNNKPYNYMACFKTPHFMDDKQLTTLVIYVGVLHFQHRQFVHGREHTHPVHNILNIILKLIEWHFSLMDESEPFIPVTEEFNPYK